jgi:hypothetical protein
VGDLTVPVDNLAPDRARMLRLLHELRDAASDASGSRGRRRRDASVEHSRPLLRCGAAQPDILVAE